MVTAGANMAFMHAVLAITAPGDEIILQRAVLLQSRDGDSDGRLHARCASPPTRTISCGSTRCARAITDRTRAIVTVSPNNPSGAVFSEASLRAVNALCRERGLYHIADEVVRVLHLRSARARLARRRFAGADEHTISMYSLSKAYGFAGWRIGYMTYPEHLAAAMAKSQDTILVCPPVAVAGRRRSPRSTSAARTASRTSASSPRSATSSSPSCRRWRRWPPCRPPTARSTAC